MASLETATNIEGHIRANGCSLLANQAMGLLKMVDETISSVSTIVCTRCGEEKPYTLFPSQALQAKTKQCKACHLVKQKEWRDANPDKTAEARKRAYDNWRAKYPKVPREPSRTADGRLCVRCNTRKPPSEFYRNEKTTDRSPWRCKTCINEYRRKWRQENIERERDRARGAARKSRAHNPSRSREKEREYRLKKFGLSMKAFLAMLAEQGGKCLICSGDIAEIAREGRMRRVACVDHCHRTNVVRGLLCNQCNRGIGMFGDDIDHLRRAADYLEKFG